MKPWLIFLLCCFSISCASALNAYGKQKYPYQLLTEDYGILDENDLAIDALIMTPPEHVFSEKVFDPRNYWQCFPRRDVSIVLEGLPNSSEDFGWSDVGAILRIRVFLSPGVFYEYESSHVEMLNDYKKVFNRWHYLMKNEQYVCLAGNFVSREENIIQGKKQEIHGWIFTKMKTKKGCNMYFYNHCK